MDSERREPGGAAPPGEPADDDDAGTVSGAVGILVGIVLSLPMWFAVSLLIPGLW